MARIKLPLPEKKINRRNNFMIVGRGNSAHIVNILAYAIIGKGFSSSGKQPLVFNDNICVVKALMKRTITFNW